MNITQSITQGISTFTAYFLSVWASVVERIVTDGFGSVYFFAGMCSGLGSGTLIHLLLPAIRQISPTVASQVEELLAPVYAKFMTRSDHVKTSPAPTTAATTSPDPAAETPPVSAAAAPSVPDLGSEVQAPPAGIPNPTQSTPENSDCEVVPSCMQDKAALPEPEPEPHANTQGTHTQLARSGVPSMLCWPCWSHNTGKY